MEQVKSNPFHLGVISLLTTYAQGPGAEGSPIPARQFEMVGVLMMNSVILGEPNKPEADWPQKWFRTPGQSLEVIRTEGWLVFAGYVWFPSKKLLAQAALDTKGSRESVPVRVALWSFSDMEEKIRSCETLRLQPCLVKHPPGEWALLLVLRRPRDGPLPSTASILSKMNLLKHSCSNSSFPQVSFFKSERL